MRRFSDGRFNEKRAKFENKSISDVLEHLKSAEDLTWSEFAKKFDVSTHTIRHGWRNESKSIPMSIALKIVEESDLDLNVVTLDAFEGQAKGGCNSYANRGSLPDSWSPQFAEFYGAMLGDGCIYSNMNTLCITGNANLDEEYIYYLRNISRVLFDINPKIRHQKNQNVIRLEINSRKITRFLKDTGFKTGKKTSKVFEIPEPVLDDELLPELLRGLFDTDGGIYRHPHTGIMLDVTSKNKSIHEILRRSADELNLPLGVTSDRVQLYGEAKVDAFFKSVGSSNYRNIKRYAYYKKNRSLPKVNSNTLLNSGSEEFDVPYHGFMV